MTLAPPLPDGVKKRLRSLVLELRHDLEDDLALGLKRLGVDSAKPTLTSPSDLPYLSNEEVALRAVIDAALDKERVLTGTFERAIAEFRKEAAYTHLNRLMGLRCLEVRGHLEIDGEITEAIACRAEFGGRPKLLWTLRDAVPSLRQGPDAEERLWRAGLSRAYEEVSHEIGVLFDGDDSYAALWPSHATLRAVIDRLNELPEDTFRADELLGWVYQYFQSEEKDRVFEEVRTKKKKVSWSDIVPVTQLYTERYMVEFLLQNSIGRRFMDMYPHSGASDAWPYYVTPATLHQRDPQPVKDWTILDPCVGSGHFLVVAFDLLVQLYAKEGELAERGVIPKEWVVPEDEIAHTILSHNLYGIDIDPRSVQLAALALYLKAKDHGLSLPTHLNLVVADAVLTRGDSYQDLLSHYENDPAATAAIEAIWHALENVRDLGSLVRVDEEVEAAVEGARRHAGPLLATQTDWAAYKKKLLSRIGLALGEELTSQDVSERIFGREGLKGLSLLEVVSRRYDVVCTNPPYMGSKNMAPVMKDFVAKHYPSGKRDLYAAFILRCIELATEGGHVAMVTQQSWMFLSSFADLRAVPEDRLDQPGFKGLLRETTIETLAHLGPGAFREIGGVVVNVALTVASTGRSLNGSSIHALGPNARLGSRPWDVDIHLVPQERFLGLVDCPLVFWLPVAFWNLLHRAPPLSRVADVVVGMQTSDNMRFTRFHWEAPQEEMEAWVSYAKGGRFKRWTGLKQLVVRWSGGDSVLGEPTAIIRNRRYFFRPGLTYSPISGGALGVRLLNDSVFDVKGAFIFRSDGSRDELAALLNSTLATYLSRIISQGVELHVGYLRRLPVPEQLPPLLGTLGSSVIGLSNRLDSQDVIEDAFNTLERRDNHLIVAVLIAVIQAVIDRAVFRAYLLGEDIVRQVFSETGTPAGWHPLISSYDTLPKLSDDLPELPQEVIDHLAGHDRISPHEIELEKVKDRLRTLYVAGPGAKIDERPENEAPEGDNEGVVIGARIPIPAETFIEELSQKLEIHPISIYWLLEEMRQQEGLVCPPEEKRHAEDYLTVKVLRMLGHRWPMQDNYEKERGAPFLDPSFVDADGIIPLTHGQGQQMMGERLRANLDSEFGPEDGPRIEAELTRALGWKPGERWGEQKSLPLDRWLTRQFFRRHVSQFKKRPIAWHLTSPKGSFQALCYYHHFDRDGLILLRTRYVGMAIEAAKRALGEAQQRGQDRVALAALEQAEAQLEDLIEFDARLGRLLEGSTPEGRIWCPWKEPDEQPRGWQPDINDGVRVNIAPVQRLGLLAADVLAKKDLKSLLATAVGSA